MIIGTFSYKASADAYWGRIATLTVEQESVQIVPVKKPSEKEPDYRIICGDAEFGAAWKRTSRKGQDFLSVSIDDPALPGPINAALFTVEDGNTATLVWTRPKSKLKAKTA